MTVKDTVMNALLEYPTLFLNSLDVYDHMFCTIGAGYDWSDGELVNRCENTKKLTAKQAIQRIIEREVPRTNMSSIEYYIDLVFDNADSVILDNKDKKTYLKDEIYREIRLNHSLLKDELSDCMKLILKVESRYKDFSLYTSETKRYKSLKTMKYKRTLAMTYNKLFWEWHTYPCMSLKYSHLCNFPENIKVDWAIAIDRMCWFLDTNLNSVISSKYNENGRQEKNILECISKSVNNMEKIVSHHHILEDKWYNEWSKRDKKQSYLYSKTNM